MSVSIPFKRESVAKVLSASQAKQRWVVSIPFKRESVAKEAWVNCMNVLTWGFNSLQTGKWRQRRSYRHRDKSD